MSPPEVLEGGTIYGELTNTKKNDTLYWTDSFFLSTDKKNALHKVSRAIGAAAHTQPDCTPRCCRLNTRLQSLPW
jgi:hypothetical protein